MDFIHSFKTLIVLFLFCPFIPVSYCYSGMHPLTIRHPMGVECFLASRNSTIVFMSLSCQRESIIQSESENDDEATTTTTITTTTMPKRAPGKALRKQLKAEAAAAAATAAASGLPPPPRTPIAKGRSRKKTTTTPPLTITATETSRSVVAPTPPTSTTAGRRADNVVITPGGVIIERDVADVAVVVGEPRFLPPRPPTTEVWVVNRGVGPAPLGESGSWRREEEEGGSVGATGVDPILAPYLIPSVPAKKRKTKSRNASETAPDPDAIPTPTPSPSPAPRQRLPPPSPQEMQRRHQQRLHSVYGPPSARGSGHTPSPAHPSPLHHSTPGANPPPTARRSVKERLGPRPDEKNLRPAEIEGKRAAEARNALHPGQKERVEEAWRRKGEEERKRKQQERKEDRQMKIFWNKVDEDERRRKDEEMGTSRGWTEFDSEEEREAEEEEREQDRLREEWEEKERKERQRKEQEEEDDEITKVKEAMKDKYVNFKKKVFFGQAMSDELRVKMYEAVKERERLMKDDKFCEGLFGEDIEAMRERIAILREGRDPDSPVRKSGADDDNNNDEKMDE